MGRQHGDHNAPHPVGLGHQREEKLETTSRGPDRLDWSAVKTTPLGNAGRAKPSRCDKQPSPTREVATKARSNTDRKTRETDSPTPSRPPSCRTRRHSAAATESTVRRSGTTESGPLAGCLAVAIAKTQRTGASPRPPLDATSRRHAEDTVARASPRPPQYSMSRIHLKNCRR